MKYFSVPVKEDTMHELLAIKKNESWDELIKRLIPKPTIEVVTQ